MLVTGRSEILAVPSHLDCLIVFEFITERSLLVARFGQNSNKS